ncbi:MAG: hypothetical protein JF595_03605 [Sphingomonadales bacterium]|nr:hypothetical protein [Sphingomonadales bacterium]
MPRHHHILNAASNLLGIALIIITGLHISGRAATTMADEIAWLAGGCLSVSTLLSYIAIRREPAPSRCEIWADRIFLAGLVFLVLAVLALAVIKL